jgi:hypothetical protein
LIGVAGVWLQDVLLHPGDLPAPTPRTQTKFIAKEEKRKIYPYSVVPGGASTLAEAKRAMSDPAVKDHYAAVDIKKLRQETLKADMFGYLSYRVGDKIYWTAKQVRIKAGETVYTDGTQIIRGRCLNCYSQNFMLPTRPREPSEQTFDTSVDVPLLAVSFTKVPLEEAPRLPPPPGESTLLLPSELQPTHTKTGGGFPVIPIIPPVHRRRPNPPSVPPPLTMVPPATGPDMPVLVVTPEPQYRWLTFGVLCVVVVAGRRRRQSASATSPQQNREAHRVQG